MSVKHRYLHSMTLNGLQQKIMEFTRTWR